MGVERMEIKRCPFCGGLADVKSRWWSTAKTYIVFVQCQVCSAQTKAFTSEDNPVQHDWETPEVELAIDTWNKRVRLDK